MAVRTFVFCDACNPQGFRAINSGNDFGRREADDRAWFEGSLFEAQYNGWVTTAEGHNLCPKCHEKGLEKFLDEDHTDKVQDSVPVLYS